MQIIVDLLEKDGLGDENLKIVTELARSYGITANMHVGNEKDFFQTNRETRTPEWLMGQFIALHEEKSFVGFIAIQTALNISHSFLEGTY